MGVAGWDHEEMSSLTGARQARVANGQVAGETRHKGEKTMSHSRHQGFTGKRVRRGIKLCLSPISFAPLLFFFHQSPQTEPVINQLAHDRTTTCLPARFIILPTCHSLKSRRSLTVRFLAIRCRRRHDRSLFASFITLPSTQPLAFFSFFFSF